jgi:hypothetical protein
VKDLWRVHCGSVVGLTARLVLVERRVVNVVKCGGFAAACG